MKLKLTPLAKSLQTAVPDANIFARMLKVDVASRTVFGRAVQEVPDASGEIFDYKSSKPHFEKWVNETKEASGGKSLGNIRAMHGATAAGKATEVTFHDDECAIDIAARIVDDNEWNKVLEGVYTGFSIGGSYVGKKVKDGDLMRYTAAPVEISLVDKPCIPTAMFYDVVKAKGFQVIKADATEEHHEFKLEAEAPVAKAADAEIEGTVEEVEEFSKLLKDSNLDLGKVVGMVKTAIKAEAPKRFADPANKKYPLDNDPQVLAAWYFLSTAKAADTYDTATLDAMKAEVVAVYKERFEGKEPEAVDATKALELLGDEGTVTKSFYAVINASSVMQSLAYFAEDMRYYEEVDKVPEGIVGKVTTCIQTMSAIIADLIASAASQADKAAMPDAHKAFVAQGEVLVKAMTPGDEKKMKKRIQKAHDMMVEAGALCATTKVDDEGDLTKGAGPELVKRMDELFKEIEALKGTARPAKAVLRIVAKQDDTGTGEDPNSMENVLKGMEPVMGSDGKPDAAATAIKFMHRVGPAR